MAVPHPQRLLAELFGEEGALGRAAPGLNSRGQRALLFRSPAGDPSAADAQRAQDAVRGIVTGVRRSRDADGEWTVADIPAPLDEAAELLGADDSAEKAMRRAAGGVSGARKSNTPRAAALQRMPAADGALDAATVAALYRRQGHLTTAERAAADRSWAYGHVIVDEGPRSCPRWHGGRSCAGFPPAR